MRVNLQIAATSRPEERLRLLNVFDLFVSLLGDRIARPPILRDILLTLLRVLAIAIPKKGTVTTSREKLNTSLTREDIQDYPSSSSSDSVLLGRVCELMLELFRKVFRRFIYFKLHIRTLLYFNPKQCCCKVLEIKEGPDELGRQMPTVVTPLAADPVSQHSQVQVTLLSSPFLCFALLRFPSIPLLFPSSFPFCKLICDNLT